MVAPCCSISCWSAGSAWRRSGVLPAARRGPASNLDEIQLIQGWEGFVRRVVDSEPIDVVETGSPAQMLSAEIASSMRGWVLSAITARPRMLNGRQRRRQPLPNACDVAVWRLVDTGEA